MNPPPMDPSRPPAVGPRLLSLFALVTLVSLVTLFPWPEARASAPQEGPARPPGQRGEARLVGGVAAGLNGAGLLVDLSGEVAFRLPRGGRSVPALGAFVSVQRLRRTHVRGGGLELGPLLSWRLPLDRAGLLALVPTLGAGYGRWWFAQQTFNFIDLQAGISLHPRVSKRLELVIRPALVDLLLARDGVAILYKASVGVGYRF